MKNFIKDASEFRAESMQDLKRFFTEREENSVWFTDEDNLKIDQIRFEPVIAEPICIPADIARLQSNPLVKFDASEEAYADTMNCPDYGVYGSTQLMEIKGHLYPVGASAIKGLIGRCGEGAKGFHNIKEGNPADLSSSLNIHCKHAGGKVTILVQDEKVRAVNGGSYAICPMSYVAEETINWMENEFPDADFVSGYVNHDFAQWTIDLSAYTSRVFRNFPEMENYGFAPAVIIRLSNTGESSVSIKPALKQGRVIFPMASTIDCAHKVRGRTASERTAHIKSIVKANFEQIFPSLDDNLKTIDKLRGVRVYNPANAIQRKMASMKMPKPQGLEAVEMFKALYGDETTSLYDCYMTIVDAFSNVMRDFPGDERKQFEVADMVARSTRVADWNGFDLPGDFAW